MNGLSAKVTARGLGHELALEEVGAARVKKLVRADFVIKVIVHMTSEVPFYNVAMPMVAMTIIEFLLQVELAF